MTHRRRRDEWTVSGVSDFSGRWRCFDDAGGPCPAQLTQGGVEIRATVVGGESRATIRFEDLEGFPADEIAEAELKDGRLEFELDGAVVEIAPCGRRRGRVIHCKSSDSRPGSWTAEEEGGGEAPPGKSWWAKICAWLKKT